MLEREDVSFRRNSDIIILNANDTNLITGKSVKKKMILVRITKLPLRLRSCL